MHYTLCSKISDAKIEITIRQILSELNILLTALIIAFLVQTLQISTKSTAQFLSNSCLKTELKNRSFQYGKVALAVRTQEHQLQFVLKVAAVSTDSYAHGRTRHCRTARSVMFWLKQRHSSMRRCFKWSTSRILLR